MHVRIAIMVLIVVLSVSCQDHLVYAEFQATSNAEWPDDKTLQFEVSELDSLQRHNVFINVRNDDTFAFSNLFLITEFEHPNGKTIKDTLEYAMAAPNGEWLGSGRGSIKENKLWYKENIVFKDSGVYKIRVAHAMRKNGDVSGITFLKGITDVGVQIEKNVQQ